MNLQITGLKMDASVVNEDIYPENARVKKLRKLLSHWRQQRNYVGTEWGGVEHFQRY